MTASYLTSPSYHFAFSYSFVFSDKLKDWHKAKARVDNPAARQAYQRKKMKKWNKPLLSEL